VSAWDERRQVVEPVGVQAPAPGTDHLEGGGDRHHRDRLPPLGRRCRSQGQDEQQTAPEAEPRLPVQADVPVDGEPEDGGDDDHGYEGGVPVLQRSRSGHRPVCPGDTVTPDRMKVIGCSSFGELALGGMSRNRRDASAGTSSGRRPTGRGFHAAWRRGGWDCDPGCGWWLWRGWGCGGMRHPRSMGGQPGDTGAGGSGRTRRGRHGAAEG